MRHGDKINNLGRKAGHRKALLKNLSISLITHKRITTTLAKAKALRTHIEPLITKSKSNTTHSRRVAFSYLQNKEAVNELFGVIAEKVANRPGGYTRVLRTGFRRGDGAEMGMIELVDFNTVYTGGTKSDSGKSKTRRSRRGGVRKAATAVAGATAATAAVPAVQEDAHSEEE